MNIPPLIKDYIDNLLQNHPIIAEVTELLFDIKNAKRPGTPKDTIDQFKQLRITIWIRSIVSKFVQSVILDLKDEEGNAPFLIQPQTYIDVFRYIEEELIKRLKSMGVLKK